MEKNILKSLNSAPLVSVIIPTFNRTKYFQEALESVLNQTYKNFEIFISDNSTNDDTEILMQDYLQKFSNIKYFHHKNFTSHDNWNFARKYNNPDAEFVAWLMDDDKFLPRKLEVMVKIFQDNLDVSLVTSVRRDIDEGGNFIGDNRLHVKRDTKISGDEAGRLLLTVDNYIGVPSNVLIRKSCLRNNDLCWHDGETGFYSLVDVSTWCQLLSKGNLFYCTEYLSETRLHSAAASNWIQTPLITSIDFAKLLKSAWERKIFLVSEQDLRLAMTYWLSISARRLQLAYNQNYFEAETATLEKTFVAMSQALTNGYKIILPKVEYSDQDKLKKLR